MQTKLNYKYTPGSTEATERGCACPVVDNHFGKGIMDHDGQVNFWINSDCKIHGYGKGFKVTQE